MIRTFADKQKRFKPNYKFIGLMWLILLFLPANVVIAQLNDRNVLEKTQKMLDEVIADSFPELQNSKPKLKIFKSDDTFFKSRFSFPHFFTFTKIKTIIFVNPQVFEKNAPEAGIKAILAHELAHSLYYKSKNRLQLFGLISLLGTDFTLKFERRADLVAIERGYGEGLIKYREWLYQNISAKAVTEKKRDYFTPEEIKLLIFEQNKNPDLLKELRKNVPKNFEEIKKTVADIYI